MKAYTNVSRKTVGEDRVAICPNFGCEYMTRVKPLKLRFLGFGKHPKCKKHHIPLVYVNERIGDFVDAALACFFDKAGLPPSELLEGVKSRFPIELESFVKGWIYCIKVGRGATIVSRYMDAISNGYLKQLTKKQVKALKIGKNSNTSVVHQAIKSGLNEIAKQYTRLLKHLRVHSEILSEHENLKQLSKNLRNNLKEWQRKIINSKDVIKSLENKTELTLKEIKYNYDQILNIGTCRSLLGLNPDIKEIKKAKITAFDRYSAYFEFYTEGLTSKFTKSDVINLIKRSGDLKNYNINSKVDKIEGLKEVYSKNMKQKRKKINLTEKDFINLSYYTIDFIKKRIGIKTDNFNDYKLFMDKKSINKKKILCELLSEHNITCLIEQAGIQDKPDIRKNPQGPSKNRSRALDCIIVISLILLICNDYDCLKNNIKNRKSIQDRQARNIIENYVPFLKKLNSNFDIEKWLPGARNYNFIKTQKLVEDIGFKKTGKKGILINPKSEKEFEILRKQLNIKPTHVPLIVSCGNCGYQWSTAVYKINQRNGKWCKFCGLGIYTFNKTKKLVKSIGLIRTGKEGILINPRNDIEYNVLKEKLNCWYCRIPIEVECGLCGSYFSTNAERLQQNHWCPKCAEGLYEQICRWYLEKILSYIFRLKINCPQTRLNKVITHYNITKYNENEKKVIENLIKFGHVDCYCIIIVNGMGLKLALEYQGGQHEKIVSKFHNTLDDLKHQKLRDKLKRELCKENKIILLEFPYDIDKYMKDNIKIQQHIVKELKNNTNIEIPKDLPLYNHSIPEFGKYRLDCFF